MRKPRVPMLPSQLPAQRLVPVTTLVPRPEPFDAVVDFGTLPEGLKLARGPRKADYLCQVEWAWSPLHNRIDAYYLSRGRSHWLLWLYHEDPCEYRWAWLSVGHVPRRQASAHEAAIHLLTAFWQFDRDETELDRFHWINEVDGISVAELDAIARKVWI